MWLLEYGHGRFAFQFITGICLHVFYHVFDLSVIISSHKCQLQDLLKLIYEDYETK